MKIIEPYFELEELIDGKNILKKIEQIGRVCYKSEDRITEDSSERFVRKIIRNGHESVIEHEKVTVRIICDRGVSHEIVRHRIASYSQESTRYCNYCNDKFGNELTFVRPYFWLDDKKKYDIWINAMEQSEKAYLNLIKLGATPQEARSVLPNSLKTEIIVTMNLREWRHFFILRTSSKAHPQMRQIVVPLLLRFQEEIPVVFDDLLSEQLKST